MSVKFESGTLYINNEPLSIIGEFPEEDITENTENYNIVKQYKINNNASASFTYDVTYIDPIFAVYTQYKAVFDLHMKHEAEKHQKQLDIMKPKSIKHCRR